MSRLIILAKTEDLSLYTDKEKGSGNISFRVNVSVNYEAGKPCTGLQAHNFRIWHLDLMQDITLQSVWEVGEDGSPGASGFYELELKRSLGDDEYLAPVARHYGLVVSSAKGSDEEAYRGQTLFTLSYQPQ